ncbi:hypothetical protein [Hymenobacter crusticola]|uniref:ASCH domain-containing protein n=1 Tax=Hymenobacter crusticola TaxID=1770526 RepID=A0A2C9ZTY0_9BACT|nr:hypothetical protein [Hymenobacter crusticola]OUJ70173.1 hypothetical protein BXP70_25320 [Hymenobacter crusticola]
MILGFKKRFVSAVADGTKPHSIRAGDRWRVGMSIQFYENVRQKSMAKIREDGVAHVVQNIGIWPLLERTIGPAIQPYITIDDRRLTPLECQVLACTDGFDDFKSLLDFFREEHGLPFTGQLVCWTDIRY